MTINYEKIITEIGNEVIIRHNEDGSISSFMADPANTDYQAYLEHEASSK
jgi:hypothetical protein